MQDSPMREQATHPEKVTEAQARKRPPKSAALEWLPRVILRTVYIVGAIITMASLLLMAWYVVAVLFGVYFPLEHGFRAFLEGLGK